MRKSWNDFLFLKLRGKRDGVNVSNVYCSGAHSNEQFYFPEQNIENMFYNNLHFKEFNISFIITKYITCYM